MSTDVYLDYGTASPLHPAAREALLASVDAFGDPLRLHSSGRRSREVLEDARQQIADGLSAQSDEIVLTSGGTESVALALRGVAEASREDGLRMVVGAVEHPCVLGAAAALERDGFEVTKVPVDEFGRVDLDKFAAEIRRPGTILASVQHANQEVGTLQPVAEAARLSHEARVAFHTDACQTAGRLPIDVVALEPDLLSISGHKFGGPPGIGALYVRRGTPLAGYPPGDDRERRRRSGMENVSGAAAMAAAFAASLAELRDQAARHWALTDRLRAGIGEIEDAVLHGHPTQRAPHLVCFSLPDLDPEVVLMALGDRGFQLGGGSVASGIAHEPSPVLAAMGVRGVAPVRIGVGPDTASEDVQRLLEVLPALVLELRRMENASSETLSRLRRPDSSR